LNLENVFLAFGYQVMKELGMEIVNGKGAQFKAKPTKFGVSTPARSVI
jgi:hypothetical protein